MFGKATPVYRRKDTLVNNVTHKLPLRLLSALRPHNHLKTHEPYVSTSHDLDSQLVDFIFYGEQRESSRHPLLYDVDTADAHDLLDVMIRCVGYLEPPTMRDHLKLPNQLIPSDHVLLLAAFEMEGLPFDKRQIGEKPYAKKHASTL